MAARQRADALTRYYNNPNYCEYCNNVIEIGDGKVAEIKRKRFCNHSCAAKFNNRQSQKSSRRASTRDCGESKLMNRTLGELKHSIKHWQGQVRSNARIIYNGPYVCKGCTYSKHVEICHIRAVADFPDSATIREVNFSDNLVALCRNCHWELDHDLSILE